MSRLPKQPKTRPFPQTPFFQDQRDDGADIRSKGSVLGRLEIALDGNLYIGTVGGEVSLVLEMNPITKNQVLPFTPPFSAEVFVTDSIPSTGVKAFFDTTSNTWINEFTQEALS